MRAEFVVKVHGNNISPVAIGKRAIDENTGRAIVALFGKWYNESDLTIDRLKLRPLEHTTKSLLKSIIEQLESCGYDCEAGRLENNTAFVALKELAQFGG